MHYNFKILTVLGPLFDIVQGVTGTQQVVIEGPLTEEYYKIREHLYSQFYLL